MNFVHLVAKYSFTGNAGCSENCLKFKMPKVPKIEVFCLSKASESNVRVERSILFKLRMLSYFLLNGSYTYQAPKCMRAYKQTERSDTANLQYSIVNLQFRLVRVRI
jgi:hypothetical protein